MTAEILNFDGLTRIDTPVDGVLDGAKAADLDCCVVLGFLKDGSEYISASNADGGDVLWLMERAKRIMMIAADEN